MNTLSPLWAHLTDKECKLLHHLASYVQPFTVNEVYEKEKEIEPDELSFYQMFFHLEYDGFLTTVKTSTATPKPSSMTDTTFWLTTTGKIATTYKCQ